MRQILKDRYKEEKEMIKERKEEEKETVLIVENCIPKRYSPLLYVHLTIYTSLITYIFKYQF